MECCSWLQLHPVIVPSLMKIVELLRDFLVRMINTSRKASESSSKTRVRWVGLKVNMVSPNSGHRFASDDMEFSYCMQLSIYCDSSQVWSNKSNREAAEEGIHISFRWEQLLVTISLDKREQSMNSRRINSEPRERLMKYLILIVIFLINDLVLHIGT